jgi:hypothetical protein
MEFEDSVMSFTPNSVLVEMIEKSRRALDQVEEVSHAKADRAAKRQNKEALISLIQSLVLDAERMLAIKRLSQSRPVGTAARVRHLPKAIWNGTLKPLRRARVGADGSVTSLSRRCAARSESAIGSLGSARGPSRCAAATAASRQFTGKRNETVSEAKRDESHVVKESRRQEKRLKLDDPTDRSIIARVCAGKSSAADLRRTRTRRFAGRV